ncbi:Malate/lactate dehydrogenase [Caloramator quimbayensis]|uniref:Malate/lactate dehydrogenase n=1 Tax=Caloramator quimbayensis TaxID=1147123 RepID=A0A1T4X1Z9_9CLOT|nr:lactate dehydrogenase [Caloramator quimbayensis]SKA83624.1 Malate/lactate dehydrogenase [Caloramator quimbayensis]
MHFYKYNNQIFISDKELNFEKASEKEVMSSDKIYAASFMPPSQSKRTFSISAEDLLFQSNEGIEIIKQNINPNSTIPDWLREKIQSRKVIGVNLNYITWEDVLKYKPPVKWNINIAGLGDVGGILLSGLKLLGADIINSIGIFDIDYNKVMRWLYESNQILSANSSDFLPQIKSIKSDEIFECDMFVFCVTAGVPKIDDNTEDVRMAQFNKNSEIIKFYAKKARDMKFKGIFAVVSDPVDLLCRTAFIWSNMNENGEFDFNGLAPEQIRGYGLGVMYSRAAYFAKELGFGKQYLSEGRVFGPHGEGLIVANSIKDYDDDISKELTEKTIRANLFVRETGYKPFIAPALSSGALSILSTLKGEWHYSSIFIDGTYMGLKNRMLPTGIEIERINLPEILFNRIKKTFEVLKNHE